MAIKARRKFKIRSMRFQIFLVIMIVGIIPLWIGIKIALKDYTDYHVKQRMAEAVSQSQLLVTTIDASGYLQKMSTQEVNAQLSQFAATFDGRAMIIDSGFNVVRDTYDLAEGKTVTAKEVIMAMKGTSYTNYDSVYGYIEIALPIISQGEMKGVLMASTSTESIQSDRGHFSEMATNLFILYLIIIGFIAFLVSAYLSRPLKKLDKKLKEVAAGVGNQEVRANQNSEVHQIAQDCNQLIANMNLLDESRQEFVSNVSHELKTPITSMKVLADSLLSMEDAPVDLYREFLTDIAAEIERESKIINDLLSLVKLDKTANMLVVTQVNMNELLEMIMKRLKPIAQQNNIELVLESFRPVTAEVDEVKISLALNNLIENAIKYNREDGWVHVTLNADHKYFFIDVEDCGMGIPEEALEFIYERFYRVDKSHSREIGGTGLGLAITKNAIQLHKGIIKVHSELNQGTTFSIRVPLNYIEG